MKQNMRMIHAGASTVISSLWAVDDLSTSLLMNRLYENMLQKNMGKAAALNEAQKYIRDITLSELAEYLKDQTFENPHSLEIVNSYKRKAKLIPDKKPFAHPYYWGAFTCNGNWN
ncbi:MAG: CHAT domain-containing protein [Desulfobacterales bacterium]|nr:CHAT domain-containing protein [Desulfobacterales bacterium]